MDRAFEYRQAEEIRDTFARHGVRYHPDDIIARKVAANRVKDRESLGRLRLFRDYWVEKRVAGMQPPNP